MFYAKKMLLKKVTNYKINFSAFAQGMNTEVDEGLLPHRVAKVCYNYSISDGALKTGIGFSDLHLPRSADNLLVERKMRPNSGEGISAIWHYKYFDQNLQSPQHQLLYFNNDGKIYWGKLISIDPYFYSITTDAIYPNGVPSALNYRLNSEDCMIFSSPRDGMWKYQTNFAVENIENGPCIASMCLHYERMFAILEGERNRLMFSANLDPTNWNISLDDAGFIDMQDERGALNKVVSFNDYVYVFRDFGVARVSAYGEQSGFSVTQLFVSSSKIYGGSVCVCGDRILLLARDGLHIFDGYSTVKLDLGINQLFQNTSNENCATLYHNGKYYLACRLNFNDGEIVGCEGYEGGYINNALIELNLKTNEIMVSRGMDVKSMITVDDGNFCKVVACFNGEHREKLGQLNYDGNMFGVPLKKVWKSPKSNLGHPFKLKRIKEIFIKTKSPCEIKVKTEKQNKSFFVNGSQTTQRVKANVFGEQVEVSFISQNEHTEISCPQIIVGVSS